MDFYENQNFFDFSNVLLSRSYNALQLIDKKLSNEQTERTFKKLIDFLIPSLDFLLLFLISLIVYFVFRALFTSFRTPILISFRRLNSKMKFISLFYLIFLYFMRQFFSCNLNTLNVIVDISDLLYSKETLLETKKEICFPERNSDIEHFEKVKFVLN